MIWRIYESHYFNKNLKLKCKKKFFTILIICVSLLSFFLSTALLPADSAFQWLHNTQGAGARPVLENCCLG